MQGIPAVGGVQYAPVIRPGLRPVVDDGATDVTVDEGDRPDEMARFTAAAAAVAARLRDRAANASGAASEVLATTAMLAQDRAWIAATEKRIGEGNPAVRAVAGAVEQFATLFTSVGRPDGRARDRPPRHPRRPSRAPNVCARSRLGTQGRDVERHCKALERAIQVQQCRAQHTLQRGFCMLQALSAANDAVEPVLLLMRGSKDGALLHSRSI